MSRLLSGVRVAPMLFLAGAHLACGGDPDPVSPISVPTCSGPVEVTVSGGTTPTFTWTPACTVHILLVEQGATDRWFLVATSEGGIAPGVRYGIVPAGAEQAEPAIPLTAGRTHDVTLYGSAAFSPPLANKEFTP